MAQAMASMAGLGASSQALLEGSLQLSGSSRPALPCVGRRPTARPRLAIRSQQQAAPASEGETATAAQSSRRAVLGLVAAGLAGGSFVKAVLAEAKSIKIGPPPPPSGGLRKCLAIDSMNQIAF